MKRITAVALACSIFMFSSCSDDANTVTPAPQPMPSKSVAPPESLTETPLENIDPINQSADEIIADAIIMPDGSAEARVQYFLGQSVDEQSRIAFELEDSAENIELATRLMHENIAAEIKVDLLSSLEYAETTSVLPLLRAAIQDASTEVVVAALRILYQHATQDDLPQLRLLADTSPDDEVREAAQDIIDSLEP